MKPRHTKRQTAICTMMNKHFMQRLDEGFLFDRAKSLKHYPQRIAAPKALKKIGP